MWRTALLSLTLALPGWQGAAWLTEDFRVWTAEGARRLEVAEHPVAAPPLRLRGTGDAAGSALPQLLQRPGGATIVEFVYTRCVSVCSALAAGFQQLQQEIAADVAHDGVTLLSISFDPRHDDADALARHAERWRADPRLWRFAAPADARDLQRLLDAWRVVVIPDGQGGYEHNAALLVVDATGRLVRIFDAGELELALAYARSLARGAD